MREILIVGGGHQGLAMAAHLSLNGEKVNLWNRSETNIEDIINSKCIKCQGVINGNAIINKASSDIDGMMSELIMITTPSSAHKDIAKMIAKKVNENTVIILNPGRTFGTVEFAKELAKCGCKALPKIAETQTIVYTCRRSEDNQVTIFALKKDVLIAAHNPKDTEYIMKKIPDCLKPYFLPAKSTVFTSLGNVGMILHCAPVLMNIGWIESEAAEFKYYYDGISQTIARFIEKLDLERILVARAMGYDIESLSDWLRRTYGVEGDSLYDCIHNNKYYSKIDAPSTIRHRYLEEDIPCGLVPLEAAGRALSVPTPIASLVIDLANEVMEKDYRKNGRTF